MAMMRLLMAGLAVLLLGGCLSSAKPLIRAGDKTFPLPALAKYSVYEVTQSGPSGKLLGVGRMEFNPSTAKLAFMLPGDPQSTADMLATKIAPQTYLVQDGGPTMRVYDYYLAVINGDIVLVYNFTNWCATASDEKLASFDATYTEEVGYFAEIGSCEVNSLDGLKALVLAAYKEAPMPDYILVQVAGTAK